MGTPAFAIPTLEALHNKGHQISAVFCQPDRPAGRGRGLSFSPVKQRALELGLTVHQPETLKTLPTIQTISNLKPEALVVVAYGLKLPDDVLNIPQFGAINLHPSLLPKYRGAAPINHALINGDRTTGITSILMNSRMDAGDILLQKEIPIGPEENAGELKQRLGLLGAELMARSLEALIAGKCNPMKQDDSLATIAPKLSPHDGRIPWSQTSIQIDNRIRGMTPQPGAFTMFKGKRLEITKARTYSQAINSGDKPGTVIAVDKNEGPVVVTGNGAVVLLKVKPQGKREMSGEEFVRGYRPQPGEILS